MKLQNNFGPLVNVSLLVAVMGCEMTQKRVSNSRYLDHCQGKAAVAILIATATCI